ncbi:MAG: peptidoglycan editing factor PgeF [Mariprofundales bacterium]|nr:peptidoglycan editing factor PgeF [Mariprofundales bacterium]
MLISTLLHDIGIQAVFSEALDGGVADENDHAASNRLCRSAHVPSPAQQCHQPHGASIWQVDGHSRTTGADILISNQTNLTLAIRTADCLPILLADANTGTIAAVHAGWRGTAEGIVQRAITAILKLGSTAEAIHAAMGPAIGNCCFMIGPKCHQQLAACANGVGVTQTEHNWYADLASINRYQMQNSGISADHIEQLGGCTCCQSNRFFSHRRDATQLRQLALICRNLPS